MNVLIITIGSRGDVQPYVALGKGLKAAGHAVTVCAPSSFKGFIQNEGLEYAFMSNQLLELIDTDAGREALEDTNGVVGTIKTVSKMLSQTMPMFKNMMHESWLAAQATKPDLILYNSKALSAPHIGEKLSIPAVLAILQPLVVPTAAFPAIGMPALPLGGGYNHFSYQLIHAGYNSYGKIVNEFRKNDLGLEKASKSSGILTRSDGQPIPVFHAFSELLIPRPADWGEQVFINGYWFMPQENNWQAPHDLLDFLADGEAPIYVGFGSMAGRDPEKKARMVIQALQNAGLRGVIATGWGGLDAGNLPERIFKIEGAPHDWLFPQMAAVVHHGGAGTTAAGLRAGKPTLICPFMGDQPFWGDLVYRRGFGVKPIPQKKMSVEKLTAAFVELKNNHSIREEAAALGAKLRAEDGVGDTVALIETLFS